MHITRSHTNTDADILLRINSNGKLHYKSLGEFEDQWPTIFLLRVIKL